MPVRRRRSDRNQADWLERMQGGADQAEHPAQLQESEPPAEEAPIPPARELLATNTGVRLACTMAAMMGIFALFLCWAEQESRVIRRFSVQSAFLTVLHAAVGFAALLIGQLAGGVPFIGLMVTLMCLLIYIAVLILLLVVRVRLMLHAWRGVRFALPAPVEKIITRFY